MTIRRKRSSRGPLGSLGRPSVAGRAEQKLFWQGIATGLSIEAAALEAGVSEAIGSKLFRKAGGMPPAMFRASAKALSGRYLSLAEREEIALLVVQGHSLREIGRRLGRDASTVSRELDRNAATHGGRMAYRAIIAQWHADRSARRPKPTKLARNAALRTYVEDRLSGVVAAPSCARGRRPGPRKDGRWAKAWSPRDRLPNVCESIFRTMRRCASATKPFTKLFLSRAVGLCVVNWRPACERDVRYGCPGRARASGAKALSHRRS